MASVTRAYRRQISKARGKKWKRVRKKHVPGPARLGRPLWKNTTVHLPLENVDQEQRSVLRRVANQRCTHCQGLGVIRVAYPKRPLHERPAPTVDMLCSCCVPFLNEEVTDVEPQQAGEEISPNP